MTVDSNAGERAEANNMTPPNANDVQNPPDSDLPEGKSETGAENVKLFLPSVLGYEKIARGAAEALAEQIELPDERIEDLKTAVAEACMNAIEHGNSLERGINVTVVMKISPEKLEVSVADVGEQPIPNNFEPGSRPMRGWGMFLIRNLVDEMEISRLPEGGNEVRMAINLVPPPAGEDQAGPAHAETTARTVSLDVTATEASAQSVQKVETPPRAVQPAEEKPKAVQPAEEKPKAVQPAEDQPKAVQPVEDQASAITPAPESAAPGAAPSTDHVSPASSEQQTPESPTSDAAAPANAPAPNAASAPPEASSTAETASNEDVASNEADASDDAPSLSSSES